MTKSIARQAAAVIAAGALTLAFSPAAALAEDSDTSANGESTIEEIMEGYENLEEGMLGTAAPASSSEYPLTVKVSGKKLTVTMEENATTGYSWSCKVTGSAVKLNKKSSKYIAPKSSEGLTGVPGKHKYVFNTAKKSSTSTIKFTYAQSWSKKGATTCTLKVKTDKNGKIKVTSRK